MKTTSHHLTSGPILKQLILVALPILLSQLLQNLYNSVDSLVVGRLVGKTALAAVTSSGDISHLVVAFFVGLSTGAAVMFSRTFGAQDYEKLSRAVHTGLLSSFCIGLFMSVVGIILSPLLLNMVRCPSDVYDEALIYLRIYLIGVFFTSMYNIAAGVLRAVGDTKTPLQYLILTCVSNVFLDLAFVAAFQMGIAGVALATILSQAVSVALILRKMLLTEDVYRLNPRALRIDGTVLMEVLRLGIPSAVQSCLVVFSNLFIQRYLNSFGSSAMAGAGVAKKMDKFISEASKALGMSVSIFVSQNMGAGNYERTRKGIRDGFCLNVCLVALLCVPFYMLAPKLVAIFSTDEETIFYGTMMMRIIIPCYFAQCTQQVFSNAIRGLGHSAAAMVLSICGMILLRQLFLNVAMSIHYDIHNVFRAYPIGWICAGTLCFTYYMLVIRKELKQNESAKTRLRNRRKKGGTLR